MGALCGGGMAAAELRGTPQLDTDLFPITNSIVLQMSLSQSHGSREQRHHRLSALHRLRLGALLHLPESWLVLYACLLSTFSRVS